MKWVKQDLQQYIQAKEYVDTIIVPLIPFQLSNDASLEKNAFQREVLSLFTRDLEKELSGRILLSPDYHYLASVDKETEINRMNAWIDDIQSQPFQHIFFVSSDSGWKKVEQGLKGTLIWLPAATADSMQPTEIQPIIRNQVQQVSELIRTYWKG
ncbi:Protein of unknown function [Lentibacillus halodurans]|uniref:DUF2487 domain-containing protein n=1 Tax=Lentibacillus halodurans TaxID=237679 RepID=A0A1I0VD68_9BACI|nr:DUF2487 family protein [Lentibacillus halodurans]SFA73940.1 Protein of unknown function [Lentibacillus halodurans]